MAKSRWARNHSPLASRREARVGGGVLCRKCPIHVTTPHYPTHAGRDARGPQIDTCPQPHHCPMPARAPALPGTHINACWLGCPRTTNRHLPPPHHCPMPARAPALPGPTTPPMRAGMPADHKSAPAPATPLPHAGEGAGAPRDHHPTHAGRDARGPQIRAGPSHTTAPCWRGRSQGPTSAHFHPPQISVDRETIASRRSYPLPDNTR